MNIQTGAPGLETGHKKQLSNAWDPLTKVFVRRLQKRTHRAGGHEGVKELSWAFLARASTAELASLM